MPKRISFSSLDELAAAAATSSRRRQHHNLHDSWSDPCQRLLNALGQETYIPPHRHSHDGRAETLIALRGAMVLILFDDYGGPAEIIPFGTEASGSPAVGVEIAAMSWHTVLAIKGDALLLEVKAGPFDPHRAKEIAPWAPPEGSEDTAAYLASLRTAVRAALGAHAVAGSAS